MILSFSKVDYPTHENSYRSKLHGKPYELMVSTCGMSLDVPLSRNELERIHQQIGEFLKIDENPRFGSLNRSTIRMEFNFNEINEESDR